MVTKNFNAEGTILAEINKEVGKRIRLFREKKGWSQEELAF